MKKYILAVAIFLYCALPVNAHSGRTNAYGCHNCNVGSCAGTYHCHNGGYGGYTGGYVAPSAPENPVGNGTWTFTPYAAIPLYDVKVDWADTTSNAYSIAISKSAGGDPGPLTDTYLSEYTFNSVAPGRWYVNIKANVGGRWSKVAYWTIDVPQWVKPTSTPTTRITPTPTVKNESKSDSSSDLTALFWIGSGIAGLWWWNKKQNPQ